MKHYMLMGRYRLVITDLYLCYSYKTEEFDVKPLSLMQRKEVYIFDEEVIETMEKDFPHLYENFILKEVDEQTLIEYNEKHNRKRGRKKNGEN